MRESEQRRSILLTFSETGELGVFFNGESDVETERLKKWMESNFSGRPLGLSGEGIPIPGDASK
jgi:hypothetical protein